MGYEADILLPFPRTGRIDLIIELRILDMELMRGDPDNGA